MSVAVQQETVQLPIAQWARRTAPTPLQDALSRSADPAILSVSVGLPDPDLFPIAGLAEAASRVLACGRDALQYTVPAVKLKTAICRLMEDRGVACTPDQVFLTMGAQQGLSLLARLLLDPGAVIVEEEFSYTGFQQSVEPYSPRVEVVPASARAGMNLDILEQKLAAGLRPALVYVMADGHNPLGATMPSENRHRLASLARDFRVPVIEDDPYGFLDYEELRIPAIRAWDSDWIYYVGSFSKLLAPSLRVGWLVVPAGLATTLSVIKEASDINVSSFAQWMVAEFLAIGALPSHLDGLRCAYGARRTAMDQALAAHFPSSCTWRKPSSGVFFWIEMPEGANSAHLLRTALDRQRVAFVPAEAFSRGKRSNGMRLNFSRYGSDILTEAVRRIANVLHANL